VQFVVAGRDPSPTVRALGQTDRNTIVTGTVRPGDVRHLLSSLEAAGKALGYAPQVSFAEGLARTVTWAREHPTDLAA
jgi:nucleoside-diphosphate-sugar epimerase